MVTIGSTDDPGLVPECPIRVDRSTMVQEWNQLTFIHWPFDPAVVQALLPTGLTVETFEGRAWVALVPFSMVARAPRGPAIPWMSRFCETNVRTYVTAPDGTRGVWFFSLEAARLAAVVTARVGYRLPYFWAAMDVERDGDRLTYTTRRRWPGPRGTASKIVVEVGARYDTHELGSFDHFLTARWRLYSTRARGLRFALAQHSPWPLHRAELIELDDQLMEAAGLTIPTHGPDATPIVHWSPGVQVRIGFPHALPGV